MVVVEYEWAVSQCYIDGDAGAAISPIPPVVAESRTATLSSNDVDGSVSDSSRSVETPAMTATINGDAAGVLSSAGNLTVDLTGEPPPMAVLAFAGDANASKSDIAVSAEDFSATIEASDADGDIPTEDLAIDCSDESPTAEITVAGEATPAVAFRPNIQKGQILRVIRIDVQTELAKPTMPIYLGSALSRLGEMRVPLRYGEPFAGFAIEFSPATERLINIAESGEARLEVLGVTGPRDIGRVVHATDETTFTVDPPTEPPGPPGPPFLGSPIGKVGRYLFGKICMVNFETRAIASI